MRIARVVFVVAFVLLCLGAAAAPARDTQGKKEVPIVALTGGTLIDGNGGAPVSDAVVVIQGRKILAAGPSATVNVPVTSERIDIRGKFILPGFIDAHIHTTYPHNVQQASTDTDATTTLRALHLMNLLLKSGVTSVRDVASNVPSMQALVGAQTAGLIDSLRLFACGDLITVTGGHGDGQAGVLAADGPWEWRKAVRQMHKAGFGLIKISPTFTLEEATAAVDEARTLGMRITAHGGGQSDTTPTTMTRIAVEAGVQCIEHLNEMEDDVLDLMSRKGVHNVPTMAVYRALYKAGLTPRVLIEKRHWSMAMHETLFRKARERKILMGIGTDFADLFMSRYPDCYFEEMKYFVELGVSPMETIVAATRNGAIILGRADELGTIEAGKLADIQVVRGNPLETFDVLGTPEIVIVDGRIHRFPR
jgi:imidazolonepropionase-like amidohydrolase